MCLIAYSVLTLQYHQQAMGVLKHPQQPCFRATARDVLAGTHADTELCTQEKQLDANEPDLSNRRAALKGTVRLGNRL